MRGGGPAAGDARPRDQAEIYDLLEAAETAPRLMTASVGPWRAWPVAKPALYAALLDRMMAGEGAAPMAGRVGRLARRAAVAPARLAAQLDRLRRGGRLPSVALLAVPRRHRFPDGRVRDAIFDDLAEGSGLGFAPRVFEYPWALTAGRSEATALPLAPALDTAALLARSLRFAPPVRRAAAMLAASLDGTALAAALPDLDERLGRILARFEARRIVFRRLLAAAAARVVVLTDSPFKSGEIAAAKSLGLRVIELQHGMFGPRCPEYGWAPALAEHKAAMPIPDRMLVFGRPWRELSLRAGFWTDAEAPVAGAAAIDRYRGAAEARQGDPGAPLRVACMTQATNRRFLLRFVDELLRGAAGRGGLELRLKIHPAEAGSTEPYEALARAHPETCRLEPPDANPFDLMIASDLVASCNSYSLAEAVGLGIPAVSIRGGQLPLGFARTFELPAIERVMPHVGRPAELAALLAEATAPGFLGEWRARTAGFGRELYAEGFLANASAAINEAAREAAGAAAPR